jgi:D-3-phosphoglycerate dehydrogenase
MKIVITDKIDMPNQSWADISQLGDVEIYHDIPKEHEIIQRIRDATIITANWVDITKNIIDSATNLKYIIVPAVGYEWIDVKAASNKGIKVINCPTQNTWAVAEHAIGLMFAIARNSVLSNYSLKQGNWQTEKFKGVELRGKKLGIVGYGKIGKKVAILANGLQMKVDYANSKTTQKQLDELISVSDFLCINAPLTEKTRHLIDDRRLHLIKPTAFLINVARGAIIDQQALIKALQEHRIAGAALDVFENEPLTGKPSPEIIGLANLSNVVATPHIAYNTQETSERLGKELIDNIKACIAGKPQNVVN